MVRFKNHFFDFQICNLAKTALQLMIEWSKTNSVDPRVIQKLKSLLLEEKEILSEVFEAGQNHQGEFMEKLENPGGNIHGGYEYPDFEKYYSHNFKE
jgi:hypothetical protein